MKDYDEDIDCQDACTDDTSTGDAELDALIAQWRSIDSKLDDKVQGKLHMSYAEHKQTVEQLKDLGRRIASVKHAKLLARLSISTVDICHY